VLSRKRLEQRLARRRERLEREGWPAAPATREPGLARVECFKCGALLIEVPAGTTVVILRPDVDPETGAVQHPPGTVVAHCRRCRERRAWILQQPGGPGATNGNEKTP